MPTEIKLPALGENVTGGEVLDVKVKPGDSVTEGQTLLEVQAEKSTVEVPAPMAGKVSQVLVKNGQTINVGQSLCVLEGADGQAKKDAAPVQKEAEKPAPRESQNGEGETPAEPAKQSRPEPRPAKPAPAAAPAKPEPAQATTTVIPAGPATRLLARELGVDLNRVRGSGRNGRVTQEDIKAFVRELASGTLSVAAPGTMPVPPMPDFSKWGPVEKKPVEGIRKKTAEAMALSWSVIPHVTQHDLADITNLEAFRKQQEGRGPKLTVTAFALKASAIALKQFSQFNVSLDLANGQIINKQYYHIGVAVDTEKGLVVPVIRDVDKKSVTQLATELTEIAEKARQRKITIDDMRGGCFTITNLGGIGGTSFTPIVNYPEVAILGLSRGRLTPVVKDGQIVPRLLLPLSLSYDHRVIDGADAARFTRRLAEMLENPLVMLLHA